MWLLVTKSIAAPLAFQQLLDKPAVVEFFENRVVDHHLWFQLGNQRVGFGDEFDQGCDAG
jgi:hypothetical protein